MPPTLTVPHRYLPQVVRPLRQHRVEFELKLRVSYEFGRRQDPDGVDDQLIFRHNDAEQIQALLDSIVWSNDS
ncbi:MAG: hypothetical protein U1E73_03030 [Planctomycetota bacterium]